MAAGEFILGYANAYGQYTERPLLVLCPGSPGIAPGSIEDSGQRDFGRNGSYLVFRQLRQDVVKFWRTLDDKTRAPDGGQDPAARLTLAARMLGRWPSGAPLAKSPRQDDPAMADDNRFLFYGADDAHGFKCPLGSHIRRTNPRDALDPNPGSQESIEIGKRHRIIRRGRAYGPPVAPSMDPADILKAGDDSGERGLHFICFNTHIGRHSSSSSIRGSTTPSSTGCTLTTIP